MVFISDIPESSSSSPPHDHSDRKDPIYDVFLSFRGADTRNSFTNHLHNALLEAGFLVFYDDDEIETGVQLKPKLESAIKASRAAIIILSKNYASSTWCLDELVLILEQQNKFNQIVIPIFYHVEPTHVRKQENSFGEAMAMHKHKMDAERDVDKRSQWAQKIELWKTALTQVANLKGVDVNNRKEKDFIEEVVIDIRRRLGELLCVTLPNLIGMEDCIDLIGSWLTDGSRHSADILTIVGMGGIGKTSLARYVFGLHHSKFVKSSFIEDINARCEANKHDALLDLQKKLHGDIAVKANHRGKSVGEYIPKIEIELAHKRVLIVLDDIGSRKQLDALLGKKGFCKGSKIIITTKDSSLTEMCDLFNPQVQPKHNKVSLEGLYKDESLELLCIHAFQSRKPKNGYQEVLEKLVTYCEGNPLALEVLGCSLQQHDVAHWNDCITELMKEPHRDIKNVLKVSFDSLPSDNNKELFKHIACFFVGIDNYVASTILKACNINTTTGIRTLINKCLLRIGWDNELTMHQLLRELGRDLVRQESPNMPWKRSRVWHHEESFKLLKGKKGKENTIGLSLDTRMLDKTNLGGSFELETNSFRKMDNLMLLQLNYVQLQGHYENFPKELRWLCMHGFPLKSIPLDIPMDNLVSLDMSYSNIESFDMSYSDPQPRAKRKKQSVEPRTKENRLLGSLKILDLSFCKKLHSVGGFFKLPALERLVARNCISLIEVRESIEQCVELAHIDLRYCYKLKKIPIGNLKNVKVLLLDGCNFGRSDMDSSDIATSSQTSSSGIMVARPSCLTFLPNSLTRLSLTDNNLRNESFPMDLSCLTMLENLYLDNNPIVSMPSCVRTLPRLKVLSMDKCDMVSSIECPPRTLRELSISARPAFVDEIPPLLRRIKFDPNMSPIRLHDWVLSLDKAIEVDGIVKIQALADVEEKLLHILGWANLNCIKERSLRTRISLWQREGRLEESPIQVFSQLTYKFVHSSLTILCF